MTAWIYRYKGLGTFLLILLLFLIPMWGAHWLYYKGSYLIKETSNHGTLVKPAPNLIQLPLQDLQGHVLHEHPFNKQWTLLSISNAKNADYLKKLYTLRQIRLMLGKDRLQVQRMLLFYDVPVPLLLSQSSLDPYSGTLIYMVHKKDWRNLFVKTGLSQNAVMLDGFFIVDSEGRLIMNYNLSIKPKEIMQDLHRLISEGNNHV